MRQRILGSHTPPCHRRMVITTLSSMSKGGGGLFASNTLRLSQKKRSLRALRAHNKHTYTSGTSCAGTRRVPFVGCSS